MNRALSPLSTVTAVIATLVLFAIIATIAMHKVTATQKANEERAYQNNVAELRQILEPTEDEISDEAFFRSLELFEECIKNETFLKEESELILNWLLVAYLYDVEMANMFALDMIKPLLPRLPKGEFYQDIEKLCEDMHSPENELAAMIEFDRLFREMMGVEQTEDDRKMVRDIFEGKTE